MTEPKGTAISPEASSAQTSSVQVAADPAAPLDEAAYLSLWTEAGLAQRLPADAAYEGGLLADRPAWVFVAGYQAAIRALFPELESPGWLAFAVTDDRSVADSALIAQAAEAEWQLTGRKGWVAQAGTVSELIVSARCRGRQELFRVPADMKGLILELRPETSFLSAMSQGRALFDAVPAARLDRPERRRAFGATEAMAMMLAATGYARRHSTPPVEEALAELHAAVAPLRDALALAASAEPIDSQELKALDDRWQSAFKRWREAVPASELPEFEADERLFRMYSEALARRAARDAITVSEAP